MRHSHPLLVVSSMAPGRLLTWWDVGKMVVRGLVYLGLGVVKRIMMNLRKAKAKGVYAK